MKKLLSLCTVTFLGVFTLSTSYADEPMRLTKLQCSDIIPNNDGSSCKADRAVPVQVDLLSKYKNKQDIPTIQLHIKSRYDTVPVTEFSVNDGSCSTTFEKFATPEGIKLDGLAPLQLKITSQCDVKSVKFATEDRYTKYYWVFERN
ncbi:hypothetical protein AM202_04816 [Actinobacillus minor 202]|uniref:Lipoprotein n=1 Tax=Actinobacillus minor 202 TaxID=591023 RepID=A0ABM9YSQ8_9PAST|nr:hypothetical protein [Actinobacillus minor]EEV24253.1 hypothetical protein AM202_04816 [Actinobacillus minor 202]